ncbi:MAG: hypothetical protein I4O51_03045 [Flavobacterium micromati]|nr:hypothetical protein [Flavobacterium micromati]
MKVNKNLFLVLCVLSKVTYSQVSTEKLIHGEIRVDSLYVNGINVVNLGDKEATVSANNGKFFILAKVNDVLVLSALHLEAKRIIIASSDFENGFLPIKMFNKVTRLDEVIVKNNQFNVVSLGIVTKAPVKYTTAERRLQTAGDFKPIMLLNLIGGTMPLDPLINKINGRTKRLKKLVVLEKKESNIKVISELFRDEYFTDELNILTENINGFTFYIVENENFVKILDSRNEPQISLHMIALSEEFKTLLNSKNK